MNLPDGAEKQFSLFYETCVRIMRLGSQLDPALSESECYTHGVTAPKALDNAIVNYVKIVDDQQLRQNAQADEGNE